MSKLIPVSGAGEEATAARAALLQRLAKEPAVTVDPWTRDELYEDEP